jgi:hypothetical protein
MGSRFGIIANKDHYKRDYSQRHPETVQLAVEHMRLHLAGENRLARQSDRHTGAIKNLVDPLFYGRNFFDYRLSPGPKRAVLARRSWLRGSQG